MQRANLKVPLPDWLYHGLKRLWRRESSVPPAGVLVPNLVGDRAVEWGWIAAEMFSGPGRALDLGSAGTNLPLIAALRGYEVIAVDLHHPDPPYEHPAVRCVQGDILELPLDEGSFDLVTNCSTVEHIGLSGRYGVEDDRRDADLAAMARLRALLKPDGRMLLTIPVGRDAVCAPYFRVYGEERLPRLLAGFETLSEAYWTKNRGNCWQTTTQTTALEVKAVARSWSPQQCYYALGCFSLRPLP